MEELCLFIKDNFWLIVLILSMLKHKAFRIPAYIVLFFIMPLPDNWWIIIGAMILGLFVNIVYPDNEDKDTDKSS